MILNLLNYQSPVNYSAKTIYIYESYCSVSTALSVALLQLGSFLDNAVCLVSPALVSGAICGFYHWAIANVSRTHKKSAGSTEMSRSATPVPMETKEKTT